MTNRQLKTDIVRNFYKFTSSYIYRVHITFLEWNFVIFLNFHTIIKRIWTSKRNIISPDIEKRVIHVFLFKQLSFLALRLKFAKK